ncbi:MAG: lipopolysaccharide kinase InaA family protein [Syntrophobacterales bacterium]|jgi:tRNA A-37 threonylcarbamoyl transferase component Bud32|nr:lipopolysaccharide kinase InaA family protein [Syntrophobacterales bacterium]
MAIVKLSGYLRNTLRPSYLFDVRRSFRRFISVAREDADWLAPLLDAPDAAMAAGDMLKDDDGDTIVRVDFAGHFLVIKRYNIKNVPHALSRAFRPSRAWRSWREGHRLRFFGINTPQPRAIIEERLGPVRRRAWIITDYCPGPTLIERLAPHVNAAAPPPAEGTALLRLMKTFHDRHIKHGDCKATNLLWDEARENIAVIDLDGTTQHTFLFAAARSWRRDRKRLLANWPKESGLYRWLDEHLPKA